MKAKKAEDLFKKYCRESGIDEEAARASRWHQAGMIEYTDWVLNKLASVLGEKISEVVEIAVLLRVTCRCGSIIQDENIYKLNGSNEFGEEFGLVTASCDKCGAEYETSQWGEWDDLEDAKRHLDNYINE